jgi:polyphosphate kinase
LEVCFPITDKVLAARVKQECLLDCLADNCESWELDSSGKYTQNCPNKTPAFSVQQHLLEQYCEHK